MFRVWQILVCCCRQFNFRRWIDLIDQIYYYLSYESDSLSLRWTPFEVVPKSIRRKSFLAGGNFGGHRPPITRQKPTHFNNFVKLNPARRFKKKKRKWIFCPKLLLYSVNKSDKMYYLQQVIFYFIHFFETFKILSSYNKI